MGKDARLSFRISDMLSDRIDQALQHAEGQIRDRSEFGTKAIKFYLDYIENTQSEDEIILNAIVSLANHVGENGSEIARIEKIIKERTMIPSLLSSNKVPESHPDFEKLIGLLEKIDDESLYKELSTKLKDALYDDIPQLYEEYSSAFFLGKSVSKKNLKVKSV